MAARQRSSKAYRCVRSWDVGHNLAMTDAKPRVRLTDDVFLPMVGFGTWQLAPAVAYESTRVAIDAGYRLIDTATMYGNEADVGRAIKDSGVPREGTLRDNRDCRRNALTGSGRPSRRVFSCSASDHVDLWPHPLAPERDHRMGRVAGVPRLRDAGLTATVRRQQLRTSIRSTSWSRRRARARGEPDLLEPDPIPSRRVWTGHRERGVVLEGYSPLKRTNLQRCDAGRDRRGTRRHAGSGRAALAHRARDAVIPGLPNPTASCPTSTSSASR